MTQEEIQALIDTAVSKATNELTEKYEKAIAEHSTKTEATLQELTEAKEAHAEFKAAVETKYDKAINHILTQPVKTEDPKPQPKFNVATGE